MFSFLACPAVQVSSLYRTLSFRGNFALPVSTCGGNAPLPFTDVTHVTWVPNHRVLTKTSLSKTCDCPSDGSRGPLARICAAAPCTGNPKQYSGHYRWFSVLSLSLVQWLCDYAANSLRKELGPRKVFAAAPISTEKMGQPQGHMDVIEAVGKESRMQVQEDSRSKFAYF